MSKRQKALQKRYEEFQSAEPPKEDRLTLPVIKNPANLHSMKISSLTYSINEGLKVKVRKETKNVLSSNFLCSQFCIFVIEL